MSIEVISERELTPLEAARIRSVILFVANLEGAGFPEQLMALASAIVVLAKCSTDPTQALDVIAGYIRGSADRGSFRGEMPS